MRRKEIEKVPYITIKKCSRKKDVKYIGITAIKIVNNEKHFFLEVYENQKESMTEPKIRIVCTKKDFGTYEPQYGTWSRQKISDRWYTELVWENKATNSETKRKENVLYSDDDLKRMQRFFNNVKVYNENEWWRYIEHAQTEITREESRKKQDRKYERRRKQLEDRIENTEELDQKRMVNWADRKLFKNRHMLYYKKRGRYAEVCCSACGGVYRYAWKPSQSYEGQFEKIIGEPVAKHIGTCEMCGERGIYQQQGRAGISKEECIHIFAASRFKEKGAVIRYIAMYKEWVLEQIGEKDKVVMHGAYEKLSMIEEARAYFEPGKRVQIDYHKHNPYIGEDFWDDCNLSGLKNIQIESAVIYDGFDESLKGTMLQYSAIEKYCDEVGRANVIQYMKRYMAWPQMEMIVKLGLTDVATRMMEGYCGIIADENAKRPDKFLGITKEQVQQLIEKKGDYEILEVMKTANRLGARWSMKQTEAIAELRMRDLERVLDYVPIQKMMNYIEKQSGTRFGDQWTKHIRHQTAITYMDYLDMRNVLGYDMNNSVYLFPKNLRKAHNKMMEERDERRLDARIIEAEAKYQNIAKNYRKLRKRFCYQDDTYIIRPARSAKEIIQEGRILHHCVGGDNYLSKHNRGESYILFLRFKNEERTPYITVEIREDRIVQWYGAYDKKPDQKNMQKWLDAYVTRLKCTKQDEDISAAVPVMAYA